MQVRVLVEITDDATAVLEEVASFVKVTAHAEDLGLSLADAKELLGRLQRRIVEAQAERWTAAHRACGACGKHRRVKGSYPILFRTLFGDMRLQSPRLHRCPCDDDGPATFSPLTTLIPGHVAPERLYLEARWASLVPYAAAAELLCDVLPISSGDNATTVRQHVLRVAERLEAELPDERGSFIEGCPSEWEKLPCPEGRIVVGLDGGYVRDWSERKRNFEIIVGRSLPEDRAARYIGLVHGYDAKPKRRLVEVLRAQGLQANQEITFITDGGEEVRTLADRISPEAEHVLDWFHITMRITVLGQYARGVGQHNPAAGERLLKDLERIKWLAWHGNIHRLRDEITAFVDDVAALELPYPNLKKFTAAAGDLYVYMERNRASLINYGERYRAGERISSAFVEATVNAVVSKRFAKKQQMQWTPRGAHLLLQTRTRALDGTLRSVFERWHPGLTNDNFADREQLEAA